MKIYISEGEFEVPTSVTVGSGVSKVRHPFKRLEFDENGKISRATFDTPTPVTLGL